MFFFSRVPLARLNLTHDWRRLCIRVAGVAFAVFLMFAELGFYTAVLDAAVKLIEQFNGQIFIVNKAQYALAIKAQPFTTRRLAQAREAPGVQAAYPVYLEYATSAFWKEDAAPESESLGSKILHALAFWKQGETSRPGEPHSLPIRVIAFDPDQPVLNIPRVNDNRALLKTSYKVLLDSKSKEHYGDIKLRVQRELAQHFIYPAAAFQLGTDFACDGNIVMSDFTYAHLFPNEMSPTDTLHFADVGVVRIDEGSANVETVRHAIRKLLPDDVEVYTKEEFITREKDYWRKTTPIGYIFWIGMIMGFVVGLVICFQIISTDVAEHLPEYATLKAIGYHESYLNLTVLREALWLAALGFLPGCGASWLLYRILDEWVGLPMTFTTERVLLVILFTTAMCVVSGLLALRKVRKADPAEVFA